MGLGPTTSINVEHWTCVSRCVSFTSEIGVKRLHTITQDDTQILMKANTYNETGGLDIFVIRLSRRKQGATPRGTTKPVQGVGRLRPAPFWFRVRLIASSSSLSTSDLFRSGARCPYISIVAVMLW